MLRVIATIIVVLVLGWIFLPGPDAPAGEQRVDLGQVLDRTEFAIVKYQQKLSKAKIREASDAQLDEFAVFLTEVLNNEPRFYDKQLGIEIGTDAKFTGYADDNANGNRDTGEGDVFTVEIDEADNRLIATDVTGWAADKRFAGSGFIAGALLGRLIGRQRAAGIAASSFQERSTTPRSSYVAPKATGSQGSRTGIWARLRSGGLRAGK
ncbi:MAG: hypothetical protein AB3N22_13360 [Ruegeria sp.]